MPDARPQVNSTFGVARSAEEGVFCEYECCEQQHGLSSVLKAVGFKGSEALDDLRIAAMKGRLFPPTENVDRSPCPRPVGCYRW